MGMEQEVVIIFYIALVGFECYRFIDLLLLLYEFIYLFENLIKLTNYNNNTF